MGHRVGSHFLVHIDLRIEISLCSHYSLLSYYTHIIKHIHWSLVVGFPSDNID